MSDINGGQYPNPNGSPIFPGTVFTGPLIAGNIIHSDGSGTLAAVGETNVGTANQGYVQMSQSQAGVTNAATTFTTTIVIPAQSQIIDIYMMTTTVGTGTFGVGTSAGGTTALTAGTVGTTATLGQQATGISPSTSAQALLWDNVGNTDVQITLTFTATNTFVGTVTVSYLQGINLAS